VLGWQRRQGELLLVLADGSKSLIPAGWTDLESPAEPAGPAQAAALGSVADLPHACTVLAPLLRPSTAPPVVSPVAVQAVMIRASRTRR
jgi:hypothetical protein